jgi:glyceraldehyde 3-phosphate dehydrogenase
MIAINGFGRIGRLVTRGHLLETALFDQPCHISHINDPADNETLAHLLTYDSTYGTLDDGLKIEADENGLVINDGLHTIKTSHTRLPSDLSWGASVVIDCSGALTRTDQVKELLTGSVQHVIVSGPYAKADFTCIVGANDHLLDPNKHRIVSMGSCTTNCAVPILDLIHQELGIESGYLTTIHAMTGDQCLLDRSHKDLRRSRTASASIIPTKTGADAVIGQIIPELAGKIKGSALRVPTQTVSAIDLTLNINKSISQTDLENLFIQAAAKETSVIDCTSAPLVSTDFKEAFASAVVDIPELVRVSDTCIRILAWYDNEWTFALRVRDTISLLPHFNNEQIF